MEFIMERRFSSEGYKGFVGGGGGVPITCRNVDPVQVVKTGRK